MMSDDLGGDNLTRAVMHPGDLERPDDQPAYGAAVIDALEKPTECSA
jgi:hypothetical protein